MHVGKSSSSHNHAKRKCEDLLKQKQSIQTSFDRQSSQTKLEYKIRLKASIEVVRLLLNQGLAFRGHREDESSLNKGNFLEILSCNAERCDKIRDLVLKKAPKNDQLTSHKIQKDIIIACKIETVKAIMDNLNGDFFALLVDESCDVSRKEQLAVVLRYVNRCGSVVEHFIGIVHVRNTSGLCLKEAIADYLAQHSLSLSYVRGQCYDGASNMQGDFRGLKTLIQQESKSAYSIHCFAHQLQLTLVAVSKKCLEVGELVLLVSNVLNIVGGSYKRMDDLRESQAEKVQEALDMGELETGRGLNQELGLARAADTRWGSHYKSFKNFISMFGSIIDVLDTIVVDAWTLEERAKVKGYLSTCQTFEVAFMLHLMRDVLEITNELNTSLQKKEQDIANAILLVEAAKKRLQKLREEEWGLLIDKVSAFCVKYNILIPNFDDFYVNSGRSRRKVVDYTILHYYRVDIIFKIIDWQVQELNACFNEVTTNLLVGVACLNPVDSFSSFDINKILMMAELYPGDFDENIMVTLKNQLETYIVDVRDFDERFSNLHGLVDLSKTLVKTKKHLNYSFVFRLVKFALLLPVATATVERTFSAMKLIKSELRNRMNDEFMSGCLVPYVERKIFTPFLMRLL
uniref:Zinc finger MYM-type protein 1-like n=1 Tax=Nicotiana sylvestris TaxID=4096 RepID=A0A1U7Y7K4_NICSY|nr:PREDICTED: zinc finger MYM-type protein 1-like [Nicotiana sylvestris]XP_009797910.1 PREDICTED: zinc finger MYM-type protein 1-like [Nicotiana sylvestris]XP_009797911.1 PREDICTED: zinc finger MYM-type protein 1-like [Nicotiana sylvestris]XP_009797913.1 PREDICTED: zinc finger MYM-type protein 1-like [Nicotiana sylvestris]XP_009797914.1 PREDICTED: zinc finger MYM-type protein 1-like [Nicotiana sylvestris]XP_009797915.1 PREDICTED: zinc finger MYM-type protein 1-like [Nicotiana sylvestris]XP_00